jgi:2',3'-cyclic-nucleotide 2'-phosphodiesterase/3'-nucleotidase
MLYAGARIPAGRVTIRQIDSLYVYENYLYTVEMNGARLRAALEHSASLYQSWPLPAGQQVRLPDFNVDTASGVDYTIDLRRPVGHRVMNLRYKSKPLEDAQPLRVAMNNYRYTGGGGYDFKDLPIVYRSTEEIRDLIIAHLTRTAVVPATANRNWHIEPRDAVEALRRAAMKQDAGDASFKLKMFPEMPTFAISGDVQPTNVRLLLEPQHNLDIQAGNRLTH